MIRQPKSIRPWQNVLDPLLGYLKLAENLFIKGNQFATSFNFGPTAASNKTVFELMKSAEKYFPISWEIIDKDNNFYETPFIGLEITKAQKLLNWEPKYSFEESIEKTMIWYKKYYQNPAKISYLCKDQIEEFLSQ